MAIFPPSKSFAGHQDEQHQDGRVDEGRHGQDHEGSLCEQFPDVRLADAGEVERGVLAQADEGQDGVQGVLVRGEEVDAQGEG